MIHCDTLGRFSGKKKSLGEKFKGACPEILNALADLGDENHLQSFQTLEALEKFVISAYTKSPKQNDVFSKHQCDVDTVGGKLYNLSNCTRKIL